MRPESTRRACVIDKEGLQCLLDRLIDAGYEVIGPVVQDYAILYRPVDKVTSLPAGVVDEQVAGRYRLGDIQVGGQRPLFSHVVGPDSWKRWLHPPQQQVWRAERRKGEVTFVPELQEAQPARVLLGVRACEVAAIRIQDRVLVEEEWPDTGYRSRREALFIIAVNCSRAGGSCFCASMGTGPEATEGFDLVLTELIDEESHRFLMVAGSEAGERHIEALPGDEPTPDDFEWAARQIAEAANHMGREMPADAAEVLINSLDHPHWEEVAARCLHCANCTMVCPTCFCTSLEERTTLDGSATERWRQWDSCFNEAFSYMHGGPVRKSGKARYRQWLTHKLAQWEIQFGTSGCTGCGRCITWCPVGIDITEEVRAFSCREENKDGDG
ncbi:MAG TPA: sulfite reductase subunit A [Chromatiales bacterium]|nr:sulfite reductase subunit A [Chromatiales bacterium]